MFARTKQEALKLGERLKEDSEIKEQGIVYRRFIPLKTLWGRTRRLEGLGAPPGPAHKKIRRGAGLPKPHRSSKASRPPTASK
jgi:hypothetical protein